MTFAQQNPAPPWLFCYKCVTGEGIPPPVNHKKSPKFSLRILPEIASEISSEILLKNLLCIPFEIPYVYFQKLLQKLIHKIFKDFLEKINRIIPLRTIQKLGTKKSKNSFITPFTDFFPKFHGFHLKIIG